MPVIEYIEDSEHESSGRKIPKGSQHIVTRERARELCEEQEIAVVVGTKTGKSEQDRTRGVNNAIKGEKSQRVQKKVNQGPPTSDDMNADEAIEHIKNTKADELDGFLSDDEDRSTVLRAWESKFDE